MRDDVSFEGMRWVTVGPPSQPDGDIVLELPVADPNASAQDRRSMAELLAEGVPRGVICATDDCDATFERVGAAGAEVLREPTGQPRGVRGRAFRDPSGTTYAALHPAARVAGPEPAGAATAVVPPMLRTVFHG